MLLAGTSALAGDPERWDVARRTAEWIHANVVDTSGAVWDGCRPRGGVLVPEGGLWSYNVGTVDRTADIAADIVTQARAAWDARDAHGRFSAGWVAPARGAPSLAADVSGVRTVGSVARLERLA